MVANHRYGVQDDDDSHDCVIITMARTYAQWNVDTQTFIVLCSLLPPPRLLGHKNHCCACSLCLYIQMNHLDLCCPIDDRVCAHSHGYRSNSGPTHLACLPGTDEYKSNGKWLHWRQSVEMMDCPVVRECLCVPCTFYEWIPAHPPNLVNSIICAHSMTQPMRPVHFACLYSRSSQEPFLAWSIDPSGCIVLAMDSRRPSRVGNQN